MKTLSKSLTQILTNVCVFVDCARNWENYDLLEWNELIIEDLAIWIGDLDDKKSIELNHHIYDCASSALTSFKTDWTIATVYLINHLQSLGADDKRIIKRYLDERVNPDIKHLPGVIKAFKLIESQLII